MTKDDDWAHDASNRSSTMQVRVDLLLDMRVFPLRWETWR